MEQTTLQAIQAHAMAEYPRECCGLIVATAAGEDYVPCANTAAKPSDQFRMPAEDYAAAEDLGEVLAVVHSHPNSSAAASDADRVMCEASGLPWHIVSVGQVAGEAPACHDIQTIEPCGYEAPLVGRQFAHGTLDCYTLVSDFYARKLGIHLSQYDRDDNWWDNGQDLYSLDRLRAEGFELFDGEPQRGDMILMQIRSPVPNHAGVYLGEGKMLHHLYGRLSETVIYGGMWAERTRYIVRHREARHD
ncbi:MAG: C40 family peptidase [Stenotrophomonas maltophilia]|uniref:C40 family peptidase n=1 Tax=Stenotrophomonas maltophilia TaxID=40324 RepID=UPI0013DAFAF7|nr:C40 family peptidase [Stenotrophomonas maltophilia]MBS4799379.1 C40 family peptidase [Stenotrophomonas maltophilia]